MADFLVGLWSVPHTRNWQRGWRVRALDMRKAIERLDRMVQGQLAAPPGDFHAIFLAPEYYFTDKSDGVKRLPLADQERRDLEDMLMGFTASFPKILIIPGSSFYLKAMQRGADPREQLKFNPLTGQRDLPKNPDPDARKQHLLRQISGALAVAGPAEKTQWMVLKPTPQGLSPAWWDPADAGPFYGVVPPLEVVRTKLAGAKPPRVARNAVMALLGGKRVGKYDKHADFFEANGRPDEMVYIPGTKNQCPTIGGFKFGFEICCDHANAVLKKRAVPDLAFHVLVSDHVKTEPNNMAVANGGYFLHASTVCAQTCVYRRDEKGNLQNLTTDIRYRIQHEGGGGEYLDFYKLPLPG